MDDLGFVIPLPTVEVQLIEAIVGDGTIKAEATISVPENSDVLRTIQLWTAAQDGTRNPYDFTGATEIDFYGKTGQAVPDSESFLHYTLTDGAVSIVGPATNGVLTVQFAAMDLHTPGVNRYRLDVIKAGLRTPVMAGLLIIQDL